MYPGLRPASLRPLLYLPVASCQKRHPFPNSNSYLRSRIPVNNDNSNTCSNDKTHHQLQLCGCDNNKKEKDVICCRITPACCCICGRSDQSIAGAFVAQWTMSSLHPGQYSIGDLGQTLRYSTNRMHSHVRQVEAFLDHHRSRTQGPPAANHPPSVT